MPSSSDSSTVMSNDSSRAITSSTRSRLSASRSSPKRASGVTLSAGTCSTSTAQALNFSKAASLSILQSFLIMRSVAHPEPAVDREGGAGDEAGLGGREEDDGRGNL